MYLWNTTAPSRDGDLDNGVIIHEYGHGVSQPADRRAGQRQRPRQPTSRPARAGATSWAYMLTMPNGTEPAGGRGIGTYVLGQATTGDGIRRSRYSTNLAINTETYDSIKAGSGASTASVRSGPRCSGRSPTP